MLRTDADLAVVVISDADDRSAPPHAPTANVQTYVDLLRALKGPAGANRTLVAAVVGDAPNGCGGAGGSAEPGPRYRRAASLTFGPAESVCAAGWSALWAGLADALTARTAWILSGIPVISTLVVRVDGVPVPPRTGAGGINWTYDFGRRALLFNPSLAPAPGAQIEVSYVGECL